MAGLNKYQAYPEYRDSGVEWIDAIPFHWEVLPTFSLCEASTKKNIDGAENNVLSLSYGNIIPRDIETNFGLLPESFNTYQLVENGDIILRLTDLQNDKNSLRVGLVKQKGIITSAYLKLSSQRSMLSEYLYRLLHSYDTTKVFYGMGGGLRQSMKFEDFRRLPLLLPSKNEQVKIVDFLDYEIAKIDKLIEKQQQLIELLKEKRQAVISHAVTKGLNPDVPMKDSGVEWLGEIPQHWSITKGCYIGRLFGSESVPESSISDFGQLPFIKVSTLSLDSFIPYKPEWFVNVSQEKNYNPETNYIVFPKRGAAIFTNKVNIIREHSVIDPNLMGWKVNKNISNEYYAFVLKKRGLSDIADISTVPQINNKHIAPEKFPHPPYNEQLDIVNSLKTSLQDLDYLIGVVKKGIEYTQERRTALISAAVTGKIDLRNWTAPIPEAETPTEASA
ncbi:restriction endonuclease subunit S [Escherichia coli]|uniref:restriction endonuclease subunit S n=1 Tax=Escherichia coli TaxID=562 RepID=UPI000224399E|nr:restriction endonuclease subunit S [Escherichia coli]EFG1568547.1 restriction endonuclease subunit S [Escherichia coli]EFL5821170.1 restriction endonuclease subunit S [Escherichia coli]EGI3992422.1 restriction endonuclease subunit S [Escherichia coli]EGI4002420.1 restriction endonuclease subunit S [Escherichia coli]EGI4007104.1 restriction endonuclease subunit S [Escherichia coli]